MSRYRKIVKTTFGVLSLTIASIILTACDKASLPAIETARVKELMAIPGRLDWFSAKARAAISSKDEQDKIIKEIESQMPSLAGHAVFSCWVDKEDSTGEDILMGGWRAGLLSTGLLVGRTNFVPPSAAWPRYRFEKLTNGVYVFYTS